MKATAVPTVPSHAEVSSAVQNVRQPLSAGAAGWAAGGWAGGGGGDRRPAAEGARHNGTRVVWMPERRRGVSRRTGALHSPGLNSTARAGALQLLVCSIFSIYQNGCHNATEPMSLPACCLPAGNEVDRGEQRRELCHSISAFSSPTIICPAVVLSIGHDIGARLPFPLFRQLRGLRHCPTAPICLLALHTDPQQGGSGQSNRDRQS